MGLGVWGSEVFGGGSAVLGVISDELGPSAAWRKLTSGLASDLPIFLPPCLPCTADLPLEERAAFLKETRHAFGRTALVLRWARLAVLLLGRGCV